jgi:methylglutaconyl-CoA hydratase
MSTVLMIQEGPVVRVKLNRPEVRNAFNDELIAELERVLKDVEAMSEARVVVLSGAGDFFCAGADLNWMKSFVGASKKKNEADARRLARLLARLDEFPKPTIAQVQGTAIGGGVGLVAACDIAVAVENTIFALAEVKLGLIPAVISPFVIAKMGESAARRYFLTGERFRTDAALRYGLIHEVAPLDQVEALVQELARQLLSSGPQAIRACKKLIRKVASRISPKIQDYTVKKISELRVSAEGQEGISAFFEKRKPNWHVP